jgi:hypothetical protein
MEHDLLRVTHIFQKCYVFMEPEISSPSSQKPLVPIMPELNHISTFTPYFSIIYSNVILLPMLGYPSGFLLEVSWP